MRKFILDTFPNEFFVKSAYWQSALLGMVYVFIVLTQLFTFEDYTLVMGTYGLADGSLELMLLCMALPLVGILSVPYLLSMKLSRVWMMISSSSSLLFPAVWFCLSLLAALKGFKPESGLLGATIPLQSGVWMVIATGLLLLVASVLAYRRERLLSS